MARCAVERCLLQLPRVNDQLHERTAVGIRCAQRGPLGKFPLFEDVQLAWFASNSDRDATLEWSGIDARELARREVALGAALVQLIKDGSVRELGSLVKLVKSLQEDFEPVDRSLALVMHFFQRHAHKDWSFREVDACLSEETGLQFQEETLRRWCARYGFPLAADERAGRPPEK